MLNIFKTSFVLKNTYRVNGILYSLKQVPLLRRLLPQTLYGIRGLKAFANLLALLWEFVSIFLGKLLYMLTMVTGIGVLYEMPFVSLYFFTFFCFFFKAIGR